jgi:hypothetical protein
VYACLWGTGACFCIPPKNNFWTSWLIFMKLHMNSAGRFLSSLTGSQLCASWQLVHRQQQCAYEFCRWISMPNGW